MNNELKPKIRFKGFTDDWEQRKLKDIGEILTGSTPSTSNEEYYSSDGILWVTPTDINSNIIKTTARRLSIKGEKVARIVPENTILVTCIASIGKNALVLEKSSFNQQINSLTPFDKYNPYFLLTDSVLWSNTMKQQGSAGMMQIVNKNEFSEIETNIPSEEEQNKIGNLYKQIDNLITLHQRKCDKLIELKKSLLEKMFPQNNSVIPEIRFKGFTDDWEQRKLSTLIRKPITDGPHETPQLLTSGIPFISVEAIHDGIIDLKKCRGYISEYDDERFKQKYIPEIGDVFFTKAATIGRVAVVDKLGFNIWSPIGAIKPDFSKTISKYLYYVLQTDNIMKEALLGSNSSSQYNLSMDAIENFTINIPKSINEQVEVSKLLTNIDNLITLHQRKHDKLNKIKQSLLNDMFV